MLIQVAFFKRNTYNKDNENKNRVMYYGDDYKGKCKRKYKDVEEIAQGCRFRNCKHETEPGCTVQRAIDEGFIHEERLRNYKKLPIR